VQIRAVEHQELARKTLIAARQPEAQQQRARRSYLSASWLGTSVDASVALIGIAIPARHPASNTALNCEQKKIILSRVRRPTNRTIANSRESYGQKLLFELTAVLAVATGSSAVLVWCLGCTWMVHETRLTAESLAKGASCACTNIIPYRRDNTAAPLALFNVLQSTYREFPLSSEVSAVYSDLHNYALMIPLGRKLYTPITRYRTARLVPLLSAASIPLNNQGLRSRQPAVIRPLIGEPIAKAPRGPRVSIHR
jgi:hypothetical protein